MIPKDLITEWRDRAPWVLDRQVEQDLVISRALVELFSRKPIADALAFRGGTALYKLHMTPAARYSEDIDLVQTSPGGIGEVLDAIHAALDPWLGKPKWKQTEGRVTLNYRFDSEDAPPVALKLKIEINSREHFTAYGLKEHRFEVESRWFTGTANLRTYELDELLGTKLRALYQRKKGRDLFDLGIALQRNDVSPGRIVEVFAKYMVADDTKVTRAMFEQNLAAKKNDAIFTADMTPLLAHGQEWNFDRAFDRVWNGLVARLPGEPWKGA
ncbi:MAG: nucleotidyl transferase AbiEii/AbiGii toxin family protein [Polyangiaceae bacterium]